MSLTNVKDLDYLLCLQLESEKDLLSFCSTNKYYYSLYNNDFIWRCKMDKYKIPNELINGKICKTYYSEIYRYLKNNDIVRTVFLSICDNRSDILYLLLKYKNIDPNFTFCFNKNRELTKAYYSNFHDANFPDYYSPISLVIKGGCSKMWNVLKPYIVQSDFNLSHLILSIVGKNIEILKHLLKFCRIDSSILYFSIQSYNLESTKLLLEYVDEYCVNSFFNTMIDQNSRDYLLWTENRNSSFEYFLNHPKVSSHIRFYRIIGQINADFLRLLTHYNF